MSNSIQGSEVLYRIITRRKWTGYKAGPINNIDAYIRRIRRDPQTEKIMKIEKDISLTRGSHPPDCPEIHNQGIRNSYGVDSLVAQKITRIPDNASNLKSTLKLVPQSPKKACIKTPHPDKKKNEAENVAFALVKISQLVNR